MIESLTSPAAFIPRSGGCLPAFPGTAGDGRDKSRSRNATLALLVLFVIIYIFANNRGICATADIASDAIPASAGTVLPKAGIGQAPRQPFPALPGDAPLSLQKAAEEIAGPHQKVKVGFYFNSAGKIDFQTSSLPLDFYLWMLYRGDEEPKFEFMNARMLQIEKQEEHKPYAGTDVNYLVFKVSGIFDQNIDYRNYPFDAFTVRVLLEDVEQEIELREYIPDLRDSALDESFRLVGWDIRSFRIENAVHTYSTSFGLQSEKRDRYSQIAAEIDVSRLNPIIFAKTVAPAIIFILIATLGSLLPLEQISQKISLAVAALFSSVAYHINLSQGLPPLSYLTFIDRMMIANYSIIFLCLVFSVGMHLANKNGLERIERFFSFVSHWLVPVLVVADLYMLLTSGKMI
ncbi:MAG TPA: hypothetical protein VIV61_17030 [Candidatus Ozemobacteraceae bacterium]